MVDGSSVAFPVGAITIGRMQCRILALLLIAIPSNLPLAAEPDIKAYAISSRAQLTPALVAAKQELEKLPRSATKEFRDEAKARIAELENPLEPYYAPAPNKLKDAAAGDIGWFDETVTVHQLIDDSNVLVQVRYFATVTETTAAGNIYQRERPRTRLLQLSGLSTEDMEGGVTLKGVFAIRNGELATLGWRAVPIVEPVDIEPHKDLFTRKDEIRTWTSANGRKADAVFVRTERGKVVLMNLNGKTAEVKLADLGDDDREYVRQKIKELKPLAKVRQQ